MENSPEHTSFSDLAIATVCIPKGINNTLQEKDIVFVAFEDNSASQPIIIGQLYREALLQQDTLFLNADSISISSKADLPIGTFIGDINVFLQIKQMQEQLEELKANITELQAGSNK